MGFRPHGVEQLTGLMIATREHMPTMGFAGGFPGARTQIIIRDGDGGETPVSAQASHVEVRSGQEFHFRMASAGGYGDPLNRDPAAVLDDVLCDRMTAAEAEEAFGVVIAGRAVDDAATQAQRAQNLKARLAQAAPARKPVAAGLAASMDEGALPLYPGVVQQGRLALSERSGAVLAQAPDPWTGGCPTITTSRMTKAGIQVAVIAYIDPLTGHALAVDSRVDDGGLSFASMPERWISA
jgi:N-methylhydantoinase B